MKNVCLKIRPTLLDQNTTLGSVRLTEQNTTVRLLCCQV